MPKTATQAAEQINEASTALAQISARQTENTIALAKARQDYLNNVRGSTIELRRLKEEQEDLAKFSAGWRGTRQAGFDFFAAGGGINPAFAGKDAPKPATASETRRQAAEAQAAAKAAAREDIADQQERLDMLKDYRELLNNIHDDATKRGKRPGEMPGISVDLPDMDEVKRLQSQADSLTALAKAETRAEATAQALANGLQRSIADGITNGFLDGAKSFAAFGENLKRTIISAISESIANDLVVSIMGGREGGGLRGLMSGLGGLFGKKGAAAGAAQAGAASTAATTGGVASFGGIGLGLAGLGIFAGSQILNLFKPDKNQGYGTFMPGQSITPQAEVARAGTYNAPSGFNAGAYRFEAGRPSNTNVTGNTIVVTLPEGTPREQAEAMLREFERLARAQGLPAGTLPTSQG
jgi:hypothetical protein